MPLIEIRRNEAKISGAMLEAITKNVAPVAAKALTCEGGSQLNSSDIMFEIDSMSPYDQNCKDIHVRVWAHDYPARRGIDHAELKRIRKQIAIEVVRQIKPGLNDIKWYVWVWLGTTSYGSDSEED